MWWGEDGKIVGSKGVKLNFLREGFVYICRRKEKCTSQQKVDTTLYFYTSFNEHNTPYTVLESDNSESMPDVLH